jgi:hypothetical protein
MICLADGGQHQSYSQPRNAWSQRDCLHLIESLRVQSIDNFESLPPDPPVTSISGLLP